MQFNEDENYQRGVGLGLSLTHMILQQIGPAQTIKI